MTNSTPGRRRAGAEVGVASASSSRPLAAVRRPQCIFEIFVKPARSARQVAL
eukprot:COSAG06_NODE_1167_length_10451_cov_16.691654_10_plen_52_part_00